MNNRTVSRLLAAAAILIATPATAVDINRAAFSFM